MRKVSDLAPGVIAGGQLSDTDIFISYSREDREVVRRFAQALTEERCRVWWDGALHSGETFDEVIEEQLRAAKAVVVLWSPRCRRLLHWLRLSTRLIRPECA